MDIVIRKKQWFISIMIFYWSLSSVFSEENSQTEKDLTEAESSRSKLEIVKQIKKINDDGSYTIGYEADDGSFKIESRDVLGNIKGTYGFVDENGEIKRVTYSTKNDSDTKYTAPTVVQRIPKTNRTYASLLRKQEKQQPVTTTPSVIQSIPRRRFVFPTQSSTTSPKPTTTIPLKEVNVVYAHSISKDQETKLERQLSKPSAMEEVPSTETTLQKHTLETSLSEADSTIKPVTEEPEVHGNSLRRQLFQERRPEFDARQLTIQQSTDLSDIYTGSKTTGTPRPPLFTTTARSRSVPILSTTARALNATPFVIKQAQTTSSTRNQFVIPEYPQEQTTTESTSSNEEFRTQVPVQGLPTPPYLRSHQRLAAIQHPSNGELILVPAGHPLLSQYTNNNDNNRPSGFISPSEERSANQNHYRTHNQNVQILQGSPVLRAIPIEDNSITNEPNVIYGTLIPVNHRAPPLRVTHAEHELQRQIDEIEPPVSVNDFQKILDQLIIRQKKLEMVNSLVSSHIQDPLMRSSMILIPQRVPFQPVPYRQREYNPNIPVRTDQTYSQSKRMVVDRDGTDEKFLPPLVREMLLLKMLKLAINPYLPLETDTEAQYSVTSNPAIIKTGGQRNVEILGEEVDEADDSRTYRRNRRSVLY